MIMTREDPTRIVGAERDGPLSLRATTMCTVECGRWQAVSMGLVIDLLYSSYFLSLID
jgi:hypothetical protein